MSHIVFEDMVWQTQGCPNGPFMSGHIAKPVVLFGKLCFAEGEEHLALEVERARDKAALLPPINGYLAFLADARGVLETAFVQNAAALGARLEKGHAPAGWYGGLVAYPDALASTFVLRDATRPGERLVVEFDGQTVRSLYYE